MKSYEELYTLVEERIRALRFDKNPRELYDPISYMLSLGGKRLRPVLVLMAADLVEGDIQKAMPAALAVEIFHNFTLVHDDIMDQSAIRRGKPTVHEQWDLPVAILSGDLMMIQAVDMLCETETTNLKKLVHIFNQTAAGVCEGQQLDMNFEKQKEVSVNQYLEMISLKTGVLLGGSLKLGALIGGASDEDAEQLFEFGRNIGVAFQIQDDILDSFGDAGQTGKKVGGDIAANKKTLLLIKALETASETQKAVLEQTNDISQNERIASVLRIYHDLDVRGEAEKIKQACLDEAFMHLDRVSGAAERKKVLKSTATNLMQRIS